MNLAAYVLTKLCTPKGVVRQMPKKTRFRRLYNKQHVKRSQTLLKSAMRGILSNLLINVKKIVLEKVSLGYMKNLVTVC